MASFAHSIDPPDEIAANKLTAIVGRAEERDLVDLMFLERAGYSMEAAELRTYVAELIVRLLARALPA